MDESGHEDDCNWRAVILEEDAHGMRKQSASAEYATGIGEHEDEQRDHHREVERPILWKDLEHLDALLQVYTGDIESEDVAGETGNVA